MKPNAAEPQPNPPVGSGPGQCAAPCARTGCSSAPRHVQLLPCCCACRCTRHTKATALPPSVQTAPALSCTCALAARACGLRVSVATAACYAAETPSPLPIGADCSLLRSTASGAVLGGPRTDGRPPQCNAAGPQLSRCKGSNGNMFACAGSAAARARGPQRCIAGPRHPAFSPAGPADRWQGAGGRRAVVFAAARTRCPRPPRLATSRSSVCRGRAQRPLPGLAAAAQRRPSATRAGRRCGRRDINVPVLHVQRRTPCYNMPGHVLAQPPQASQQAARH
jgi:hypothetical protein